LNYEQVNEVNSSFDFYFNVVNYKSLIQFIHHFIQQNI